MARSRPVPLRASAGPRISASRWAKAFGGGPKQSSVSEPTLDGSSGSSRDIAGLLITQLDGSWRELLPWSTIQPPRNSNVLVTALLAMALIVIAVLLHLPWWLAASPVSLVGLVLWRHHHGDSKRASDVADQILEALLGGAALESLEPKIAALIVLDPRNDTARFLLALLRLMHGQPLSALMQLAPLRDRHPDVGEIVLLASLAYTQLGHDRDALRMLEALRVDLDHPWYRRVKCLEGACRNTANGIGRARLGADRRFDLAPE